MLALIWGPLWVEQRGLDRLGTVQVRIQPAVEQVDGDDVDTQRALGPARQQLLGDGDRVVVCHQDRRYNSLAHPQRLDQVSLLRQRVVMICRLVRCAESEEVGEQQGVLVASCGAARAQSCEELGKPCSTVIDGPEPRRRTKTLRSTPRTLSATRSPARHHSAGLTTDDHRSFRGE